MSETQSEEMKKLLREVARPAEPGEHVPHVISRIARRLGWERGRTKRLWYGEARRIDAAEMDAARQYLNRRSVKDAEDELLQNDQLLQRLAALLVQDEEFHRVQVDAFLKARGVPDRSVAEADD